MTPLSRLFQRHAQTLLDRRHTLVFNPPADLPWQQLTGADAAQWRTQDAMARDALQRSGRETALEVLPPADSTFRRIILAQPREKGRLQLLLHALGTRLEPDGELFLGGEIRAGARSAGKLLATRFRSVEKLDSARHCVLYRASDPIAEPFSLDAYREEWTLERAGAPSLRVVSYPGVFAHGKLDAGTALLLPEIERLPLKPGARVLDLGCGAGVLGALIKQRHADIEVLMSDSSTLATLASRETLAANRLQATVITGDGLAGVSGRFDLVLSNPPFHDGHREREDLGAGLFEGVGNFLRPRGQLMMVVNRHLPWPRWMNQTFGQHEVSAANNAYHVLSYRKPITG